MADDSSYVVTCICYNGAGAALRTPSPPIATDFTVPACTFTAPSLLFTDPNSTMDVQWACLDRQSGLRAVTWAVGSAAGASDVVAVTAVNSSLADVGASTLAEQLQLGSESGTSVSWLSGRVYFVTLGVTNNAGLSAWYTGPGVLVDFSPPVVGAVRIVNAVTIGDVAYVDGAGLLQVKLFVSG